MRNLPIKYNKIIPFPGYFAICLFGIMFIRDKYKNVKIVTSTINHEGIHVCQALDFVNHIEKLKVLGFIIFYLLYFIEWLIKLIISIFTAGNVKAYRSISFEQEAYDNQYNYDYQDTRKKFAWLKYIFKLVK